jgi:8-oxo-dGTP pyrophosphatase MutT (NUDIX family)
MVMTPHFAHPVLPSPSATLILVRQAGSAFQVYLLRRSLDSATMPGAWVFPGGILEADDRAVGFWRQQTDVPVERLPDILDGTVAQMLPFAVAAIRETWEEAGLLLAEPRGAVTCPEPDSVSDRPFSEQIEAQGLYLALSRLGRWHHWITPRHVLKRFDTYFFTAMVDPDCSCAPDHRELIDGNWMTPLEALTANHRRTLPLSPPTLVTLHQLLPFADLDGLKTELRHRSWPSAIMPRMWPLENGFMIVTPWDPQYAAARLCVAEKNLDRAVLPVGSPFSRLWCRQGICLPVAI